MAWDDLREVEFRLALKGYNVGEVDEFLECLAEEVDGGGFPVSLIKRANFNRSFKGYSIGEVDRYLANLLTTPRPGARRPPLSLPPNATYESPKKLATPKPTKSAQRVGWFALAILGVAALCLVGWSLSLFIGDQIERYHIEHGGIRYEAKVVNTSHDDSEGSSNDYLWVRIPRCRCDVEVPTDDPEGHRAGSSVPVRYDPADPAQVIVLVNEPSGWFGTLSSAVGLGFLAVTGFVFVVSGVIFAFERNKAAIRRPTTSTKLPKPQLPSSTQ